MNISVDKFWSSPQWCFTIISSLIGLIWLFLTPPFQVPDEVNHFYRAYQIADGHFRAEQHTQRLGGHIPRSLIKAAQPFLDLRWQMNRKTSGKIIREQLKIPLNPDDRVFIDFPNTALYNPISYLPQVIPVFILKQLRLPPLIIFYGARLFTLFIWIFFMHQLIKSLKYYRWLMTFLVLLPMTLFVSVGISADVMTNLWAFGFMGFILNQMHLNRLWTYRDFLWASLFVFMLASAKLVYMLLIFLFLLIPVRRFSRPNSVWLSFGALLLMGMTVAIFWAKSITTTYIPYDQYNLAFRNFLDLPRCANMHDQFNYLTSHHLYAGKVFINSLVETFPMYYSGYIGTFGWLDTKLPDWSIHLSYAILFLFALVGNHGHIFKWQQRIILLVTACITTMALLMSQLLSWECVGSDVIKTIQGRYFIPIFPLLFLAISGVFKIPGTQKRWSKVTLLYLVIILTISTIVIYKRYYVPAQYQIDEIYCDVETQNQNKLVTSQPDIYLDNADQRSNDFAHSGQFALKLNAEHPYGFTFRTTGGHYGDMIEVEVWRLGNTGSIVIVGDGGKAFYAGTNESRFEKDGDWNKLTYRYTLEEDLPDKEIAVYIFNKSETSYFDDITIRIMRRKNTWGI